MSLTDYAAGLVESRCAVCRLPSEALTEVAQNEAKPPQQRIARRVVVQYIKDTYNFDISVDSLYKHFANHV